MGRAIWWFETHCAQSAAFHGDDPEQRALQRGAVWLCGEYRYVEQQIEGGVTTMNDLQLQKPLRKGDEQGQVKLVQEWLCLHGEHVVIDGDFGPATEAAVKDFQAKSGVGVTGI